MSSLFNHIFIPTAILLLFSEKLRLDSKKVLIFYFFAVLPDVDYIFSLHRALFHNIFIVFLPLLYFVFLKKRRDISGIIFFYLASHLILDMFNGGIFLLYPVYDGVFFASAELRLDQWNLVPVLNYGISNRIMNGGIGEPLISSENIGVALLLSAFFALSAIQTIRKRR